MKGLLPRTEGQAFLNVKDLLLDCQCHEFCASLVGAQWEDHAIERYCCDDGMFEGPQTQLHDVYCPEAAEGDMDKEIKGDSACCGGTSTAYQLLWIQSWTCCT
jgi:hypothetical protein